MYTDTIWQQCNRNGNSDRSSDLALAKARCLADDKCVGLYDECGSGTEFLHCNAPLTIVGTGCKSVLYQLNGK